MRQALDDVADRRVPDRDRDLSDFADQESVCRRLRRRQAVRLLPLLLAVPGTDLAFELQLHLTEFHSIKAKLGKSKRGGVTGHARYAKYRQLKERADQSSAALILRAMGSRCSWTGRKDCTRPAVVGAAVQLCDGHLCGVCKSRGKSSATKQCAECAVKANSNTSTSSGSKRGLARKPSIYDGWGSRHAAFPVVSIGLARRIRV